MAKAGEGGSPKEYATPPMGFRVTWSTSSVDDTNYYVRISLDVGTGYTEIGTTTTSATQFDWVYYDKVVDGIWYPQTHSFTFKVDTILRATGAVQNTTTASAVGPLTYGQCNSDL
jgi:hypothetical protein